MKVNVLNNLPPVIRVLREIQDIGETDNHFLNQLYDALEQLMNDQFVYLAGEKGIRRWEKILGLVPSGDLETRRFAILNRLNVRIPYTYRMLRDRLTAMFGDKYSMELVNDTATLYITLYGVTDVQAKDARNMIEVIIPANLYLDFKVV